VSCHKALPSHLGREQRLDFYEMAQDKLFFLKSLDTHREVIALPPGYHFKEYAGEGAVEEIAADFLTIFDKTFKDALPACTTAEELCKGRILPFVAQAGVSRFLCVESLVSRTAVGMVLCWDDKLSEEATVHDAVVHVHPGPSSLGRIHWLAVMSEHRNKHIAAAMLSRAHLFFVEHAYTHVYLSTEAFRTGAIALYKGFGYHQIATRPDFHGFSR
jgi:ribosomal protein S18 acetylase RimI-like enzyme